MNQAYRNLPKFSISECDGIRIENILEGIKKSEDVIASYKPKDEACNVLHSPNIENPYSMLLYLLDRHVSLFNLFKLCLHHAELQRKNELEGFQFKAKILEYIERRPFDFNF